MPRTSKRIREAAADRLTPDTKIRALVRSPLLDELRGAELVVFLRIVGAVTESMSPRTANHPAVKISNAELYKEPRTAVKALKRLEQLKLVRLRYDGANARTIEVL